MKVAEKYKSRKFQVWIVWLIFAIIALFQKDLPKETIYQFFGFISLAYIGANAAQKYVDFGAKKKGPYSNSGPDHGEQ